MKKDYKIEVKVKNNNIILAIQKINQKFGLIWCNKNNLSYPKILDFINLKLSPIDQDGEINKYAEALCIILNKPLHELWSEQQLTPVENNKTSFEMTFDEIKNLSFNEQNYLTDFDKNDRTEQINLALLTLTEREKFIIDKRFFENENRETIAKHLAISMNRVSQLEYRALSKLRRSKTSDNLKIFLKD